MRGCTDFLNFQALKGYNFYQVSTTSYSCTRSSRVAAWKNTDPGVINHRPQAILGPSTLLGWLRTLVPWWSLVSEEFCG